ncbi:hypothetical protein AB0C31_42900, partial [Actinoplanes philippinensis]
MFTGLDDIDWKSLRHAHGTAEDVPTWMRGLIDPDPAVREDSLDALYDAAHHQGDIYDSTVAAVPYLVETLAVPGLPGRGRIAELLTSIAAISERPDETEPDEDDQHAEDLVEMRRQAVRAHALVVDAAPSLVCLANDLDPAMRAAAPKLLLAAAVPDLAGLLLGVLETEREPGVRRSLLDVLGCLQLGDAAIGRLLGLNRSTPASSTLAALIAVARTDPYRVPLNDVPDLIDRAYAEEGPATEPADLRSGTVIRSPPEGRRAPHCTRLLESLTDPLGPRVAERTAIVTPLLSSPHDDLAGDALFAVYNLIGEWRGDYGEAVTRIAGLLDRSQQ